MSVARRFNQKLIKLPFPLLFSGQPALISMESHLVNQELKTGSYAKKVFMNLRNKERIMMPERLN